MSNESMSLTANLNSIPYRIYRQFNAFLESRKNQQIIDSLAVNKQYNVLSVEAFRAVVGEYVKNNPDGTLFMCDINDLFQANKNRGKKEVNVMLKSMIDKIRDTLETSGYDEYEIGKMGDELYIYIPDEKLNNTEHISGKLQAIEEGELSLSVGATDDFSKGLTHAITVSDVEMCKNKKEFKLAKLKRVCGNSLERIIDSVVETQIDKMRLNLDKLKDTNKFDLRNTFRKAIQDIDVEALINEMNEYSSTDHHDTEQKDTYKYLEDKYRDEAFRKFSENATEKTVSDYILSQILSRHPIDGVVNSSYFQGLGYTKVQDSIMRDKKAKDGVDLLVTDLSGLKTINDTYGHEEGDLAICDFLEYFKRVLREEEVEMHSDIVVKGGGNSYVIMNSLEDHQKHHLASRLLLYGYDQSTKPKLSALCHFQTMDRTELKKKKFHETINSNLDIAETILEDQSFDRKIKNVEDMKSAIQKVYRQIMDMSDIQLLCSENSEFKREVIEMVQNGFRKVIEQERHVEETVVKHKTHHLDKSVNLRKSSDISK